MDTPLAIIIVLIEVALVIAVIAAIAAYRLRKQTSLVKRQKHAIGNLQEEIQALQAAIPDEDIVSAEAYFEAALDTVRKHHDSLDGLDAITEMPEPDSPEIAKLLYIRNLVCETELAIINSKTSHNDAWPSINSTYTSLLELTKESPAEPTETPAKEVNEEEVTQLSLDLENARKRVKNLEKFKTLYFELEDAWLKTKKNAEQDLSSLQELTENTQTEGVSEAIAQCLDSINQFDSQFDSSNQTLQSLAESNPQASLELENLKNVAKEQSKTIESLTKELRDAVSSEHEGLVDALTSELETQKRYIQESEACVNLLEQELNTAQKELDTFRSKVKQLPSVKQQLKDVTTKKDQYELKVYALTSEVRKLKKAIQEYKTEDMSTQASPTLKKALSELEGKYAELEEKYIDLKMQ